MVPDINAIDFHLRMLHLCIYCLGQTSLPEMSEDTLFYVELPLMSSSYISIDVQHWPSTSQVVNEYPTVICGVISDKGCANQLTTGAPRAGVLITFVRVASQQQR